jgi:hypothetical protein
MQAQQWQPDTTMYPIPAPSIPSESELLFFEKKKYTGMRILKDI